MKKFLTLVAAAAMTLSASAEVIYSWQSEGPDAVLQEGGTATAMVDETRVNYANTCNDVTYYTICLCGKKQTYPESAYVNVTLDKALQAGDVISITAYRNKNAKDKSVTVEFLFDGKTDNSIASTEQFANINVDGEADPAPSTQTFIVPESADGCTFFDMTRGSASTNLFITNLEITREGAAAAVFEWYPAIQQPSPYFDVTQANQLETLRIGNAYGVEPTDVMPVWVDEEGNEIVGSYSSLDSDPSWGNYSYNFRFSDFKSNGEYILKLPEGMFRNATGELSAYKEFYYSVNIEQLAGAMFDDFEILSITPDLSQPQAIWDNQVITINTNHNAAIGYTVMTIYDNNGEEGNNGVVFSNNYTTGRALGDANPISWEIVGSYKFIEGHTYSAEITFYNGTDERDAEGNMTPVVAKATYEFTGKVEGFRYSDIELLSITPAPGTLTISEPSDAVFTYTFSGPVNVYKVVTPKGQNGNEVYPTSCFKSNDDNTVWTIDLSGNSYVKTIDAELDLQVYARDQDGYQLKGNFGEEDASCFENVWACDIGGKSVVVVTPASGESLDRLTEVVVKSESGESMTWSNVGQITVQSIGRNQTIATLVYERPEGAQDDSATEFRFTKWILEGEWSGEPIDLIAEGSYVINISSGCFVFGEQSSSSNSRSLYSGFSITGALEAPDDPVDPAEQEKFNYVSVDPENGATVVSLSEINLTFPDMVACEEFNVEVYGDGALVATGTGMYDWYDVNLIVVTFSQPVTEEGNYEVVIPARVIGNDDFMSSDGKAGLCNPEIRLSYTVDSTSSADISVAGAVVSDVYDLNGRIVLRNASAADINTLIKGIYVVGGRKVVVK